MIETEEKLENLEVVKRNGKKVEFDGTKVALAIKKGFDSVTAEDAEEKKYTSKDIQKVYQAVIKKIAKEYLPNGKIKIEEVQDLIEDMLKKYNYDDVYENFSEYRKRRAAAREAFRDDKNMAKLQKKIEGLGLKSANEEDSKRENANIDGNSAMGTMLQFGSTISRAFTETYLMKKKFAEAHDNGDIHIHDMDFEAMGTTTCMQIDLNKLFKNGFSTGHGHLREPKDIMSYSALAAIAIQSDQNDQHGGQSIPAFDFYMAPGVLKTFKRQYKQAVYELLDFTDFISFVNMDKVEKEIDKLNSIGVKTDLTKEEFYTCLEDVGMVISSQTDNLCPLDKKVYALRDVTGTTKSVPLIAISIMSKKIASGASKILLDVKVGKGALVDNINDAKALANLMIKIGKKYNREVVCMLTDMDNPLGSNIGNSIEVLEVIDILKNNKQNNLTYLCKEMAALMLSMSKGYSKEEAMTQVEDAITNGKAYDKFCEFVYHQGGNLEINLPDCEYILAKRYGYLNEIDSRKIGTISMNLGAGRKAKDDGIDYNAGIILKVEPGDDIKEGDILAKLYGKNKIDEDDVYDAFSISLFKKKQNDIILEIIK